MSEEKPDKGAGAEMSKVVEGEIPAGLRRVHRKLERWRSTRQGRSPLPEGLWKAAAAAAREYGVFRTGQVLHLEYGKLKRVMNATRGKACSPTRFVELAPWLPWAEMSALLSWKAHGASFAFGCGAGRRKILPD